jgi:hypothetical protein
VEVENGHPVGHQRGLPWLEEEGKGGQETGSGEGDARSPAEERSGAIEPEAAEAAAAGHGRVEGEETGEVMGSEHCSR